MREKSSRSRAGDRKRKSRRKKEGKLHRVKARTPKQSSPPSEPAPRKLYGYADPKRPWCPHCEAHTEVTEHSLGRKKCGTCSSFGVYTPAYKKLACIFQYSIAVFCLLLTAWVDEFGLGIILFSFTGFIAYHRYQDWAEWAKKDAGQRVKKKLQENENEGGEEDERAKDHQPATPPPVPPSLPPDADEDDD